MNKDWDTGIVPLIKECNAIAHKKEVG